MFLNLKEKGILKTVNFNNIVEQLNNITKVIEGSSGGNISDIQLENINTNIDKIKEKLNLLETDINKYIDEGELENALKDIKLSLNDIVKTNDLNNAVNNLTTSISNLLHKIELLEQREVVDTTEFVKKDELNTKVENSIKSSIDKIETKFLENSKDIIKNNVNDKINELVGNIDTKINDKVTEKLDLEIKNINKSIDEKIKDNVSQNDLNKELKDYAKLKDSNEFINNNNFKNVNMNELNSNVVNSRTYKIDNNEFISNNSMFSIGVTDKDINLISKGKLMLNGVEVGNNELPQTLVYTDKENILNYKLSGTVADFNTFKIKNTEIIKKDNNNIIFGSENNTTTLKGTDLYFNNDKIEFNKFVKTDDLNDYAKLSENNFFTGKITGKEIKSNSIETNELKVEGKNVITDTSNFAKLNTTNDFTQKIKGTEIESNKLITDELLLNGINVNLSDYSTNNNVIKQIEKVVGLAYDGNIEDVGNKVKGKFYFDSINNYFYECIVENNLTYIDNSKFRPISNKPISNRIDNLINIKKINIDKANYIGNHQLHPKTFLIGVHINADAQLGNGKLSSIKWFPRINGDWYASQIFSNFTNSEGFKININENNVNITYFDVANSGTRLIALYELYIN
jgi:hypothetical protein